MWGAARARGARVLLRIEDHDRQRCRPEYDRALLEDLAWLGFAPDEGPVRQTDADAEDAYRAAATELGRAGRLYACDCSRTTFTSTGWTGPGCPGSCRERGLERSPGLAVRVSVGGGSEGWLDLALGPSSGLVAAHGDPAVRDRHGNWTYGFAVVVDDLRHEVDLVVRGSDLATATPEQIRLARLLGRPHPPRFLHHPLLRKASGAKLSKADGDTAVRDLRLAGAAAEELIGRAAAAAGLIAAARPMDATEAASLVASGPHVV